MCRVYFFIYMVDIIRLLKHLVMDVRGAICAMTVEPRTQYRCVQNCSPTR